MGSGWSEEQAQVQPQPQPQPPAVTGNAVTRGSVHGGNSSRTSVEEKPEAVGGKAGGDQVLKLPHGLDAIVKDADSPVDRSSMDKLLHQLSAGIFLNRRTKKYWLDKKTNSNCFMLFPRALSITWAEDSKYWKWKPSEEASNTIEIVELRNVCWLEIHGKIKTAELSPGTQYVAAFVVMIKGPANGREVPACGGEGPAYGWEVPVNIKLKRPDGSKQERKENLVEKPRGLWIEIPAGDFMVHDRENTGEIEISMYEYEAGMWKKGLILKGVVIRPKKSD